MSRAPMPDSAEGDTPMPSSFDEDLEFWEENRWAKLGRRLKEEPLIPLGLALTCFALFGATRSIRKGDKESTNRWFRARLYAQGFTIVCICAGAIYWREDRQKRKHYNTLLGEKRAREKKEAWIRELEARDKENEEERIKRAARRQEEREEREGVKKPSPPAPVDSVKQSSSSPLDEDDLKNLLGGSNIVRPAMMLWRKLEGR